MGQFWPLWQAIKFEALYNYDYELSDSDDPHPIPRGEWYAMITEGL